MEEKKPLFWPDQAHPGFGRCEKVLEDRRIASVVQRTRTSRKRKAPSFSRRGSLEDQLRKGPGPHFLLHLSIDRTTYQRVMFHISSTTRPCFFFSPLLPPGRHLAMNFKSLFKPEFLPLLFVALAL